MEKNFKNYTDSHTHQRSLNSKLFCASENSFLFLKFWFLKFYFWKHFYSSIGLLGTKKRKKRSRQIGCLPIISGKLGQKDGKFEPSLAVKWQWNPASKYKVKKGLVWKSWVWTLVVSVGEKRKKTTKKRREKKQARVIHVSQRLSHFFMLLQPHLISVCVA